MAEMPAAQQRRLAHADDAQGLPISLDLTTGQAHDGQIADTLLNQLGPLTIVLADRPMMPSASDN